MHTITVEHTISMGHRLPSYKGVCSSPHGHNMRVELEVLPRLDADAVPIFTDFKRVKQDLMDVLQPLDHCMILHDEDPLLTYLEGFDFRVLPMPEEPTTEAITEWIFDKVKERGYNIVRVTCHETAQYSVSVV